MHARLRLIGGASATVLAASIGSTSVALAEPESPHVFSANVALTTNVKDKSCERSEPRLVLIVGRARFDEIRVS